MSAARLCIGSFDLRTQVGALGFFCTGCGMKDPPFDEDKGTVEPHYVIVSGAEVDASQEPAAVSIPRDPDERAALASLAGLSDEERAAIDQWCFGEEQRRQRGVLLYEGEPRLDSSAVSDEREETREGS